MPILLSIWSLQKIHSYNLYLLLLLYNSLSLVENILELKPESASIFAQEGLLSFILKRLKSKLPFNANKLYASEIISILLQHEGDSIKQQLGEIDGIDTILEYFVLFEWYH